MNSITEDNHEAKVVNQPAMTDIVDSGGDAVSGVAGSGDSSTAVVDGSAVDAARVDGFVSSVKARLSSIVDQVKLRWMPETELVGTPFDAPSPAALLRRHVMNEGKALLAKKALTMPDVMNVKWYREHYGAQELECLPKDERTGSEITGCSISKFLDIAEAGHRVSVRGALCPQEWRHALEASLRDIPFSPLPDYSAVGSLPRRLQNLMPELIRVNMGCSGTGYPLSMELCIQASFLLDSATPEDGSPMVLWLTVPSQYTSEALSCQKLFELKHNIDLDAFVAQIVELKEAVSFPIFISQQLPGDLMLLPSDAVAFSFSVSQKPNAIITDISWQVHTPRTLERAATSTLPRLRSMASLEVYPIKAMAYYALSSLDSRKDFSLLRSKPQTASDMEVLTSHVEEWLSLFNVVNKVLWEESFDEDIPYIKPQHYYERDAHVRTCSSCGACIFNRAFHCSICEPDLRNVEGNGDICLECVAEGRGCGNPAHISSLVLMDYMPLHVCCSMVDHAFVSFSSLLDNSPAFSKEQKEVWIEKAKPPRNNQKRSLMSIAVLFMRGSNGKSSVTKCHFCHRTIQLSQTGICYKHCRTPFCSMCLWHTFNQRFLDVMRNQHWECPSCNGTCTCSECVQRNRQFPREGGYPSSSQMPREGRPRQRSDERMNESSHSPPHRSGRRPSSSYYQRSRSRNRSRSRSRSRSRGHRSHHHAAYPPPTSSILHPPGYTGDGPQQSSSSSSSHQESSSRPSLPLPSPNQRAHG